MNIFSRLWGARSRPFRRVAPVPPAAAPRLPKSTFVSTGAEIVADDRTIIVRNTPPADIAAALTRGASGNLVAPWPMVDKYPLLQGSNVSLQTLAGAYRSALIGYRLNYVDLLDELLEREPHGFAVLSQRFLPVAGARLEVCPAVQEGDPRYPRAKEVAEMVDRQLCYLPERQQAFARLLWGLYYGVAAEEIMWRRDGAEWCIAGLNFIHSRRLAYPDPFTWDLHVWDQGLVGNTYYAPTSNGAVFGIKVKDYPNKFVVHTAQLRGNYPTRDGLGRELGDWFLLKRIAARGAAQYLERFGKPWALGTYNTADPMSKSSGPRVAEPEDINGGMAALQALGNGSLTSFMSPDSIKIDLKTPDGGTGGAGKIGYLEFLGYCDQQISKCVMVQTLTTDIGSSGGNRALGQVHEKKASEVARYDASCLADTIRRDLATPIVRLNAPDALDLVPFIELHVEDEPEPAAIIDVAHKAAELGMPLDSEYVAHKIGLKLAKKGEPRLAFVKPADLAQIDDTIEPLEPPAPAVSKTPKPVDADANKVKAKDTGRVLELVARGNGGDPKAQKGVSRRGGADAATAEDVYAQLADDFDKDLLGWVLATRWDGPMRVPFNEIDTTGRANWRASYEPKRIEFFSERLEKGGREEEKPIILVNEPNDNRLLIIDGHHRFLAYEASGVEPLCYVGDVHTVNGPWRKLHDSQRRGSSMVGGSIVGGSILETSEMLQGLERASSK